MTTTCGTCDRPTRDAAYLCDGCLGGLTQALAEVPWLAEELETTIAKTKGVAYSGNTVPGSESADIAHWGAIEARTDLRAILVSWVLFCEAEHVRHSSPHVGLPDDNLPAMSRWLMWRVDGLGLHDIGPSAHEEITGAMKRCVRVVDRPEDRLHLGPCSFCGSGSMSARPKGFWATCDSCGTKTDAERIRERLIAELDDRLMTAAEIADITRVLGLHKNREQVRNLVNQWAKRKRISSEHAFSDDPVYRFGVVWRLLVQDDSMIQKEGA